MPPHPDPVALCTSRQGRCPSSPSAAPPLRTPPLPLVRTAYGNKSAPIARLLPSAPTTPSRTTGTSSPRAGYGMVPRTAATASAFSASDEAVLPFFDFLGVGAT
ncbi:hypothetical protein C2845_PM07G16720 [Panicum miliaceum]|uniref:Uncharacterized protein n=1 Tax=Panicum miliaceum TaxID=4540 RepID=A0A3L6SGG3_PANMI|nr:hypothetical protein C2845_PM07G16720 [Panicum miliaceum]